MSSARVGRPVRRWFRGGVAIVLAGALAGATSACGSPPAAPPPPRKELAPQWADVFDGVPDIYAVVRPQALKRDALYGSFWTSLMRVAQARGFARGATMVEAAEGAHEIIVGINKGADAALVLRGVPASLDPAKIANADGQPLFRALDDRSRVVEYELVDRSGAPGAGRPRAAARDEGALFVLPDRTWVGALGEARPRARQAFATPMNRPVPADVGDALAAVRFSGPIVHALDRHPTFGRLSHELTSATFTLKPGKGGLVIELSYDDPARTAIAEVEAKQILTELSADEAKLGWLKDATARYEGNTVVVRVSVPPRLLAELPNASAADFGL